MVGPDLATAPAVDMAQTVDMTTLGGFGDPCTDNSQCQSGICMKSGNSGGGTCTMLCGPPDCPPGYGCYGVLGVVEGGVVSYVCVANRGELCSPCKSNDECSTTSKDQCITYATGGSYCGGDCTTVSCPAGYKCVDVPANDMGGGSGKQCVPNSGACDCNAMLAGATKACTITTPFGTCNGTRTCVGATGWGSCTPPSTTDVPDGNFGDENCDGIDGDITKGIFVSTTSGTDQAGCGASYQTPCKTIGEGILRATSAPTRPYVYVQAGVYNEELTLVSNVTIVGGFDANWQRADRGAAGHNVRINGNGLDSAESQYLTVKAHNVTAVALMDVDLYGVNADSIAHPGLGTYVVHAVNATLTLTRVGVYAARGADGIRGRDGASAPSVLATASMNAPPPPNPPGPGNAQEFSATCNNTARGVGGAAGTNSCADGRNPNGGPGGGGGTMDTNCSCGIDVWNCNYNASDGISGGNAPFLGNGNACIGPGCGGAGGLAGTSDTSSNSTPGNPGGIGLAINGAKGGAYGGRFGLLFSNYWVQYGGGDGGRGDNGGGGAGGGGSGGDDKGVDSTGAGGGGGGAGGCSARSAGTGGSGGGGSFGVLAIQSTVTITGGIIQLGTGGTGGTGGNGGTGQNGGAGAYGGDPAGSDSKSGGKGGDGAHGGHSGAGAGGNGGNAYGIYAVNSTLSQSVQSFVGGVGGVHGAGGAPATDPSGVGYASGALAGDNGLDGLVTGVCTLPSPGGC